MKKKLLGLLILAGLVLSFPMQAQGAGSIKIWVKGNFVKSDVPAYADKERTMVPLRLVSEHLGKRVIWNREDPNIIVITNDKDGKESRSITMCIDERLVFLGQGGKEKRLMLDHAPEVRQNRTFVPLRNVAELFGEKVSWDQANQVAIVGEGYHLGQTKKPATSKDFLPYLYNQKMAQGSLEEKIAYEKAMGSKASTAFPGYTNKDVEVALAWLSYHASGNFNDFRMEKNAIDLLKAGKLYYSMTEPGTVLGGRTTEKDLTYPRRYTRLYNDDFMANMVHFAYYPNFDGTIDTFRFPLHDHYLTREETINDYQRIFSHPKKVSLGNFSKKEVEEILKRVDGDNE